MGEPLETTVDEWTDAGSVTTFNPGDMAAPIASGSFPVRAVCVVPCSMATAASIATGVGTNLIHRVADVAIKERRPLVVVPRESPLSSIHLRNLLTLSELGVTVLPPIPAFYKYPSTVEDVVYDVTQRALVAMGLRDSLPDALQYGPKRFDTEGN
jgi:4-hydroxy-3-polyprenylbenzoate decarboxylase